jgi:uncharacterized protein (TIGR02448 family)
MNAKLIALAAVLTMSAVSAQASSFDQRMQQSVTTIGPISLMTERGESWSRFSFIGLDSKIIQEAQDDAAYFVATNGDVRGARLSQALELIRKSNPTLEASDLALASKILAATAQ